jgi:hypothetical protein
VTMKTISHIEANLIYLIGMLSNPGFSWLL